MVVLDFTYRRVDALGRIVLPAQWRRQMSDDLVMFRLGDEIIIKQKTPGAFSKLKGSLPVKKNEPSLDEFKAKGAMDWSRE